MSAIHNNNGDAYDNDFSSHTTNYIHLQHSAITTEYNTWLKQTGSLLQTANIHTSLQPLLQLLTITLEPERIFLVSYTTAFNSTQQHCTEIIIIINEHTTNVEAASSFIQTAGFKFQHVSVKVHTVRQMEEGLADNSFYYVSMCRENFLVFSESPYRLQPLVQEQLQALAASTNATFQQGLNNINGLLKSIKESKKQNAVIAAILLCSIIEQVCRTVFYCFGEKDILFSSLWELLQQALYYLPSLQLILPEKDWLDALDNVSVFHTDIFSDSNEEDSLKNLFIIVENIITAITEAFESKLLLLEQSVSVKAQAQTV